MDRIYEYLKNAHLFYIATCEDDQPRVRPFGFVMKFHDKLWFSVVEGKLVFDQMMKNPKIELCIIGTDGTWLRVAGTAVFDPEEELLAKEARAKADASSDRKGPDLGKIYPDGMPVTRLFYIKDADARIYAHGKGIVEQIRF